MDFTWRVSDCEELVGITWSVSVSVKNYCGLLTRDGRVGEKVCGGIQEWERVERNILQQ